MQIVLWVFWLTLQFVVDVYAFCLLFSYLIKVVALLSFICCYQHVLVNKDIHLSYIKYMTTAMFPGCFP